NRSLDSFLSFSRRNYLSTGISLSDEEAMSNQEQNLFYRLAPRTVSLFQELYRLVLAIYSRMASDSIKIQEHEIPFGDVLFDNWLFDLTKLLDICSIFGASNANKVKEIIKTVFDIQKNYQEDFMDFLDEILEGIIPNNLKLLNRHRKREDLDTST